MKKLNAEQKAQMSSEAGFRIRIGFGFNQVSGSRRAKMTHKSRKIKKLHVFKCWSSLLRA